MKLILWITLVFSSVAYSHEKHIECNHNHNECGSHHDHSDHHEYHKVIYKEKIKWKTRWKTKYVAMPTPSPKVITKTKVKKIYFKKKRKKNSLSLLGMATKTDVKATQLGSDIQIDKSYEPDFGMMYQRDFTDHVRFSLGATVGGSGILGIGWNY